jgi:hypothetical protein
MTCTIATRPWFDGRYAIRELPMDCVKQCSATGPVDDAVDYWVKSLQFDGPSWLIRQHLKGYGAWTEQQLCDHQANLRRLLWTWACSCKEGDELLYLD